MLKFISFCTMIAVSLADFTHTWSDGIDTPAALSWDTRAGMRIFSKADKYMSMVTCKQTDGTTKGDCMRTISSGLNAGSYYGPFDSSIKWRIRHRLECTTQAEITVAYKMAICGAEDDDDVQHTKVFLGYAKQIGKLVMNSTNAQVTDPGNELQCGTCQDYRINEVSETPSLEVEGNDPFFVEIAVTIYDATQFAYLYDFQVTCQEVAVATYTPAPHTSGTSTHDDYCIHGLSGSGYDEFAMTACNGEYCFEKNDDDGIMTLHEGDVDGTYENKWVFSVGAFCAEDDVTCTDPVPFAYCTESGGHTHIFNACGCRYGSNQEQECNAIKNMDDSVVGNVWIATHECTSGHPVITSIPLTSDVNPFRLFMEDETTMMSLLTTLCVASFFLGMCTLYVCRMACNVKSKPYQKVNRKDVDMGEDELDHVLAHN
eukprot:454972_1